MKSTNKSSNLVKWIVIPGLLIIFWFLLSLIFSSYKSFTVLQYAHNENKYNNLFDKKLLKGQKLSGQFTALEDHLGIIVLKFGNVPRVDFKKEDELAFRIKEEGGKWLYTNNYRSGQITPYNYFPFGFQPIVGSAGKTYIFELLSKKGDASNAVETGHTNPIYLSKYKFSKEDIFSNKIKAIEFAYKKLITFFTNLDALLSSTVFLLPLAFYLLWITVGSRGIRQGVIFSSNDNKKIKKKIVERNLFTIIILTLMFVDLFLSESLIIGFTLGILGLWIINIYINSISSKTTFILAFVIISATILAIFMNWDILPDKTSSFAYFLLVTGFIQKLFEERIIAFNLFKIRRKT